jgi:hypothetical protein
MMLHPLLQRQQHLLVLAIERCALPLPTKKILLEVLSASAETALLHQAHGSPTIVLWCQVDLARWALGLDLEPTALLGTLQAVVTEGILLPEREDALADGAILTWSLAFDAWPSLLPAPFVKQVKASPGEEEAADQPPWPHELLARRLKGQPPRPVWWALRQKVLERDDYTCVYCGERGGRLTLDHVLPVSRGGTSELTNLVTACATCTAPREPGGCKSGWPRSSGRRGGTDGTPTHHASGGYSSRPPPCTW